ncbi:hypothetical protein D3C85_1061420 [compost metagenome]
MRSFSFKEQVLLHLQSRLQRQVASSLNGTHHPLRGMLALPAALVGRPIIIEEVFWQVFPRIWVSMLRMRGGAISDQLTGELNGVFEQFFC